MKSWGALDWIWLGVFVGFLFIPNMSETGLLGLIMLDVQTS